MSKLGLITKREYVTRVSKKSFILITLLMPLLMVAVVFVPLWLANIKGSETRQIVVIDQTGKYASLFENVDNYVFTSTGKSLDDYRNNPDKELYAILSITGDLLQNPKGATIYSEKQIPGELSRMINQTLSRYLEDEKLASYNIPGLKEIIAESQISFDVQTIKWSDDGTEKESSAMVASVVGMVFTMIVYMFILIYGAMVMQGVMEEKSNRIIELMISSVKPFDLMMGKIIGIGLVGLTQIFIWFVIAAAILAGVGFFFMGGASIDAETLQQGLSGTQAAMADNAGAKMFEMIASVNFIEIGIYFVIFFIGGYMLYAALFAAIGSAIDHQEDSQQFMTPIMILIIFALYAGIYSIDNPDGPLAFWCSMFPFTSPFVMMVRIPFGIPLWEELLSVVLLYATFLAITWFSAKIYRVGILMYGKKPSMKEMVKWIRYK